MRVVITGATGFIGSNLARVFLEQGSMCTPWCVRIPFIWTPFLFMRDCIQWPATWPMFWNASLRWDMQTAFSIWPGGGVNREEIDSPEVQARNVAGSLDCVEAAGRLGCRVFMDAGSRVEYGAVDGIMEEEAPCRPINEYGKAKWEFYQKAAPFAAVWAFTITI